MKKLCTIGYTKKPLERFIGLLRNAGVDLVIDARLNNTSQLAGFAKRDDLAFLLREGFGIEYVHVPDLAPTQEMLDAYSATKDWETYEADFAILMAERDMVRLVLQHTDGYESPCILCSEDDPAKCHRRLLAKAVAESRPGLEIAHLM
jgi:uncharacterized protein (DUF488 family)